MFKKPFSFNGRIRRTEYGLSYILYIVLLSIPEIIFYNENRVNDEPNLLLLLFYIPMLWFLFAQGAKRCHDRGNSGWYQIIPFYVFWMLFADSNTGDNEYGPNPKGIGNIDEIEQIGNYLKDHDSPIR